MIYLTCLCENFQAEVAANRADFALWFCVFIILFMLLSLRFQAERDDDHNTMHQCRITQSSLMLSEFCLHLNRGHLMVEMVQKK